MHQRRCHSEPALIAAGQLTAGQIDKGVEPEFIQGPADPLLFSAAAQVISAGEKFQIFADGELAVQ